MQFKQCILSPFYKWSKNKLESLQSFRIVTLYHISLVLGHWDDQYRNPNDIQRSSRWAGQPHSICRTVEVGTKSLRKADQRQFWLLSPTVLLLKSFICEEQLSSGCLLLALVVDGSLLIVLLAVVGFLMVVPIQWWLLTVGCDDACWLSVLGGAKCAVAVALHNGLIAQFDDSV